MFELEDRMWWYEGMRAITVRLLQNHFTSSVPLQILDVGCGTGYSVSWLKKVFNTEIVAGVDISHHAAELWKERSEDTLVVGSASMLPISSNSFDLVTCFDVIYQLDPAPARAALEEVNRLLKPGAILFIREPAYDWLRGAHDEAVATRHRFTRRELTALLRESGFNIERSSYANMLLLPLALPLRFLSRWRRSEKSDVQAAPELLNRILSAVMRIEAWLLERLDLPAGLSVVAIARKRSF